MGDRGLQGPCYLLLTSLLARQKRLWGHLFPSSNAQARGTNSQAVPIPCHVLARLVSVLIILPGHCGVHDPSHPVDGVPCARAQVRAPQGLRGSHRLDRSADSANACAPGPPRDGIPVWLRAPMYWRNEGLIWGQGEGCLEAMFLEDAQLLAASSLL